MQAATLKGTQETKTQDTHTHTYVGTELERTNYWYKVVTPATLRHCGVKVHGCKLAIAQN